jgi:glycine hydroxymethyltransferase
MKNVQQRDPEIFKAISDEKHRQNTKLELIASENFVSLAVMEAMGSVMTNKYAEGYPAKRYYGGCEFVDVAENLARDRAKQLFGAEYANVQPHSGSQANMAVYFTFLKPGDKVMGMNLAHGGHLTHGSKANISGKIYNIVHYGVDPKTEQLDYDVVAKLAKEHKPKMLLSGASAYSRTIDFARLGEIAKSVGAYSMADIAHIAGLVVAGEHPDPVPSYDFVTGTTHKTLRGPRGGFILAKAKYADAVDRGVFPGMQGGPLEHVIAGKAVSFQEAMDPGFKAYARQIITNAKTLCEELMKRGYRIVSGGTDNHLFLVDLSAKGMTGAEAAEALHEINVTVNMNLIPFDKRKVNQTSGIRVGTPCCTTRGMKEADMRELAGIMDECLRNLNDRPIKAKLRGRIAEMSASFPVYPGLYEEMPA